MGERICLTMKEMKNIRIIERLSKKEIKGYEAAMLLNYTTVHISRLKKRYLEHGVDGLIRAKQVSAKRVPEDEIRKIIDLYKTKYYDFNVLHFKDKLSEEHGMDYCYETIRTILIKNDLHKVKKRKPGHRRKRERMPNEGMLVQMDSSQHPWLSSSEEKAWLISTVDDATGKILYAKFFESDNTFNNMQVIRKVIEDNGIFLALYTDKASHFKTTRLGGLHYDVNIEQDDTNIQKALSDLGITLIIANSPQAKGRVERSYRTLQDRLIKEMRIRDIKDYDGANRYLPEFLDYYNRKFNKNPSAKKTYTKIPPEIDLNAVFTQRFSRKVNNDNTISFRSHIIQIPPIKERISLTRRTVDVRLDEKGRVYIVYKGIVIHETWLSEKSKFLEEERKKKAICDQRSRYYAG